MVGSKFMNFDGAGSWEGSVLEGPAASIAAIVALVKMDLGGGTFTAGGAPERSHCLSM